MLDREGMMREIISTTIKAQRARGNEFSDDIEQKALDAVRQNDGNPDGIINALVETFKENMIIKDINHQNFVAESNGVQER